MNPGPTPDGTPCLSILHQNIRSIRNKLEYIKDTFLDFDVLCFTETHLSDTIVDEYLNLEGYGQVYRKDWNAYSGGLLTYTSSTLISRRMPDLETILPESILD